MDFGKLLSVDQVDFSLPPEPAQNEAILRALPKTSKPGLYIGPTGYNMKAWVGKWYPPAAREPDFLRHYAAQFNTIEFNTTHYRMPDPSAVRRWKTMASPDFRFCPKIPQSISHARDLGLSGSEMLIYCEAMKDFEESLGCSFMQLPPHFDPRELPYLALFLEKYAALTPLSVEVRHPAFFQDEEASKDYFDLLTAHCTAAVITDVAGRRDVCHARITASKTLIRFVGNGLHSSDYTRVSAWADRLKVWFDQGLQEAYFFAHEPDNLLAPELSAFCAEKFTAVLPDIPLRGPKPVPGRQGTLF